jgi:hypothetical protein
MVVIKKQYPLKILGEAICVQDRTRTADYQQVKQVLPSVQMMCLEELF